MATLAIAGLGAMACGEGADAGLDNSPTPGESGFTLGVTPASDTLTVGGSVQLVAVVRDARGTIRQVPVTWSSSQPGVSTVSGAGMVLAAAPGIATISARYAEGDVSGAASILVTETSPPPTGSAVAECAAPGAGWLFCDDFEQDRSTKYYEYNTANGGFARTASVGRDGSQGMRARFAAGQVEAGNLKVAFGRTPSSYFRAVDAGTANYREIYWRVWVRNQSGWVGGGGDKLSRAMILAGSNWSQAMIAHVWSGGQAANLNNLLVEPASGTDAAGNVITTQYNDFANLRWLGPVTGSVPMFDASHVGQWYCVEAHARLNDAGQANAVFETWINGTLDARKAGFNWVGAYNNFGINAVFLENYWNAGSPQAQERYFDNFVVATQRIGC